MKHKYFFVPFFSSVFLLCLGYKGIAQNANPLIHSVHAVGTTVTRKSVDLTGAVEDISKRTLYSSTWKTKGGKIIARYSSAIINYPDANGNLQPIDFTLHSDGNGWAADKQPNPCYFRSDRSTAVNVGGHNEFVFNKNATVNGMPLDQQIESMQSCDVKLNLSQGIHKELNFVTDGIETNYVFDKPLDGGINITEELEIPQGCVFKRDESNGAEQNGGWAGDYVLTTPDGKNTLLRFQAAICYDSKRQWCFADYSLQKKNGKTILVTSVPSSWLSTAVYPVTVDPLVIGTTSKWTGGSTVSCVYPKFHGDSILVTIPPDITITYFTIDYAYVSSIIITYEIPVNDGIFYLKTPCAKTDTVSCADSPGGGDTAGICYLIPYEDFHNPMTCCYGPSCSPQSFWLGAFLSRRYGGTGCDSTTIWYSSGRYTGFQYYFSAYIEGYTDSVTSLSYTPAAQCSNDCNLTMNVAMEYGVPPYTVKHPWAKRDTIVGSYNSCNSTGSVAMKLTIPGCPYTCGKFDTIPVPPPIVIDACGDTVKNLPTKQVVLKPTPLVTVSPDTMKVCSGTPINLNLNSCIAGTTYTWTGSDKATGSGTPLTDNTTNGGTLPMIVTYNVVGTANGCPDSVKATGVINPNPNPVITGKDTLTQGLSEVLTATGGGTYSWSPSAGLSCTNCPNPTASPTESTTYYVNVTDSEGCSEVTSITIDVIDQNIVIPNVITPNGDGKNDIFLIKNLEYYPDSKLEVFNRWGTKVYTTSNYLNDWDGGGQSDGVYYYVLTLSTGTKYHGFLQIIK